MPSQHLAASLGLNIAKVIKESVRQTCMRIDQVQLQCTCKYLGSTVFIFLLCESGGIPMRVGGVLTPIAARADTGIMISGAESRACGLRLYRAVHCAPRGVSAHCGALYIGPRPL